MMSLHKDENEIRKKGLKKLGREMVKAKWTQRDIDSS